MHLEKIQSIAAQMRYDIVAMIGEAGSGHPGGSLSCVDILATLFFSGIKNEQDRFILSKGHAAPALYALLAQIGTFERSELLTLRKLGTRLQGHPESLYLPDVEVSTGSLGQGLSISAGLALGLFLDEKKKLLKNDKVSLELIAQAKASSPRIYTILGDGELQEGQVWEAAQFAAHYKLSNLVAIIDKNGLQIDGTCEQVVQAGSIMKKFEAFGWKTIEINGHDIPQISHAMTQASKSIDFPVAIIAETIKGKGVSFMEGQVAWHGKAPQAQQLEMALSWLQKNEADTAIYTLKNEKIDG